MIKTFIFLTALGLIQAAEKSLSAPHSACPATGHALLPHENDCTKFYYCEGGQRFVAARSCPPNTEFWAAAQICTHPSLANCKLTGSLAFQSANVIIDEVDSCEYLDNGCPADFNIHLLLPHETSCRQFYYCVNGQKILSKCNRGSVFNPAIQNCDASGSIDRTCEEEDSSSEEDAIVEDSKSSEEIELLPNGCPADWSITKHLPHEYYCNKYYQCIYGALVERRCASGTHFNPSTENCDHASLVGCTLPGGTAASSEEESSEEVITTTQASIDLLENGCPVDGSINWLIPNEDDCSKFYFCVWGSLIESSCPGELHFSPTTQTCESPAVAGCLCGGKCSEETVECTGNDCNSTSEEDLPPAGDDSKEQGCTGNDCNSISEEDLPPVGDDSKEQGCTGTDCNSTSEEDLPPAGDDSKEQGCTGTDCNTTSEENLPPAGDDSKEQGCTGNDCNSTSEEDLPPAGDDSKEQGCTGTDCNTTSEEDLPPAGDDSKEQGCTGNDCNSTSEEDLPPAGDDSKEQGCTGTDCNTTSEEDLPPAGDDSKEQGCTGTDCNSTSEEDLPPAGDDSKEQGCTGNDCNSISEEDLPPAGDDSKEQGCTGDDCSNECNGNDCNNSNTENDDDPECVEPEQKNKCEEECNVLPWAHGDCDKYWKCDGQEAVLVVCSEGLHFNPNTHTCDFACNVDCVPETVQATAGRHGLRVYLPWNKIDDSAKELLKLIGH